MQQTTHQSLLTIRNLEHLINTPRFELAYLEAEYKEKEIVKLYIHNQRLCAVKNWLQRNSTTDLEDRSLADLRKLAGQLGITNYSTYVKIQLITLIRRSLV
jgi:hypothetical protein